MARAACKKNHENWLRFEVVWFHSGGCPRTGLVTERVGGGGGEGGGGKRARGA